jgi:hypothetical protein
VSACLREIASFARRGAIPEAECVAAYVVLKKLDGLPAIHRRILEEEVLPLIRAHVKHSEVDLLDG